MRTILIVLLLFCVCKPAEEPVHPEICLDAKMHLLDLQCKTRTGRLLAGPLLNGEDWEVFCKYELANGVNIDPVCLTKVSSCEGVDACLPH